MIVFSGFDGMSCGQIALNRAGIPVTKYYAAEVDKYAITVTQANYPTTIQLGDISYWRLWNIDWSTIDLIIGGSPCQGFSFAGEQLAFDDPRSKLFFVWLDILNHIKSCNPNVKFMLENVKMKKEYLNVISDKLGVQPILINSALVSAQNRKRYYWCNWFTDQPTDKGIYLRDILQPESDIPTEMYHQQKTVDYMFRGNEKWKQAGECRADGYLQTIDTNKSFTLTANIHKGAPYNFCDFTDPTALTERRTDEAKKIRRETMRKNGVDFSPRRAKELVARTDGKMNCLTATYSKQEHTVLIKSAKSKNPTFTKYYMQFDPNGKGQKSLGNRVNLPDSKHKCLSGTTGGNKHGVVVNSSEFKYRKLTPIECERLQGVDDNYTNHVSNTQRYKMLGNGWQCDTVVGLFIYMQLSRILCH